MSVVYPTLYHKLVDLNCNCGEKVKETSDKIALHRDNCSVRRFFTIQNLLYYELLNTAKVDALDSRLKDESTTNRDHVVSEIKQELDSMRIEFNGELTSLKGEMSSLKSEMTEIKGLIGDFMQMFRQAEGKTK